MRKVIGIISYLPDNPDVAEPRFNKLTDLVGRCIDLFNLPIIVVAQNWKKHSLRHRLVTIHDYADPLGITGARKELRRIFLESDYDYLIMLDDDCRLIGKSGQRYLDQIDRNPDCFIEFDKTLLKLFAISKSVFMEYDYEEVNPESGEGFEDRIFVNKLRVKCPERRRLFQNTGLIQSSMATADPLSTWYHGQNLKEMLGKTEDIIEKFK